MAAIQSSVREMQYEETIGVAYSSETHLDDHEDNDRSFFAVLEIDSEKLNDGDDDSDAAKLQEKVESLNEVEKGLRTFFNGGMFDEKLETLRDNAMAKLEPVLKLYEKYQLGEPKSLLQMRDAIYNDPTTPGLNAFMTVLDFTEHTIIHLQNIDMNMRTINSRARQTLKKFDEKFPEMFDANEDSAKAELAQRECFCLLQKALTEVEDDIAKLEALPEETNRINTFFEMNEGKIAKVKVTCSKVEKHCEDYVKECQTDVTEKTNTSTKISRRNEKRLREIKKRLEELEIEKKVLEKEKEEIERQVNTEVHTIWTKRITKIQTSLTQFTKISKHTSEVVQIIEEKSSSLYDHLKKYLKGQTLRMEELWKKSLEYKKKILMWAVFLNKWMMDSYGESKDIASTTLNTISDEVKLSHKRFCQEGVVQLRAVKCMSTVIKCSYGEKNEFYRKEHEMFEKKLQEFQEWMTGPNNCLSQTCDIEHEVFYGKIRLVVEQYHKDGTQHNVFKHISFVFS